MGVPWTFAFGEAHLLGGSMKKILFAALATVSAFAAAPAAHAAVISCNPPGPPNNPYCFVLTPTTAKFGEAFTADANLFTSIFTFNFDADAMVGSSVITLSFIALGDIDLTSVLWDGSVNFTETLTAGGEEAWVLIPNQSIAANSAHTITVNGSAITGSSYSGDLNAGPPIPEPAVWSMMLLGFGAIGYSLRRRPSYRKLQAV